MSELLAKHRAGMEIRPAEATIASVDSGTVTSSTHTHSHNFADVDGDGNVRINISLADTITANTISAYTNTTAVTWGTTSGLNADPIDGTTWTVTAVPLQPLTAVNDTDFAGRVNFLGGVQIHGQGLDDHIEMVARNTMLNGEFEVENTVRRIINNGRLNNELEGIAQRSFNGGAFQYQVEGVVKQMIVRGEFDGVIRKVFEDQRKD